MRHLILRSPAKINLFLKVINKRKDGYHNICTLFERIDLFDELRFQTNRKGTIRISCSHPHVPTGSKNLVYKVAQLLKNDFSVTEGVDITIKKRIPVAAGLGGGSSNAATALLGLNKIWKLSLSKQKLLSYAKKIGADVPFFLHECSWGVGTERGDRIKRLPLRAKLWHVLVVPRTRIYSHKVYQRLKLQSIRSGRKSRSPRAPLGRQREKRGRSTNLLTKKGDNVNILIHNLNKNNIYKVGRFLLNDLETSILGLSPNLGTLIDRIESLQAVGVALSGSGPSIFGLAKSKGQAKYLKEILSRRYKQVYVVRTF